ncbi:polysaccharide pyruvyl transferase family protein [Jannaschia pohangensis]|uniref:Polysaccharide pyruvyl transferase family protein WcaK n=1 Tax=Jannaschia pohangensis TaxID=390807 RepID=A0A1I3QTJ7_9RHOB|nr:polysaccharide pyruvyl transferase family protein [Jannaschia pohangensis]SFJ37225.1 Polysaccharide pyruvyl transferase family protein WcaK [Jannaschia pohangensis]
MTNAPAVACMNVKFSPNLGDGLLSECLEQALIAAGADPGTRSVDLAGRSTYGDAMAMRGTALAVLDALPGPVRRQAVRLPLRLQSMRKWGPHYDRELDAMGATAMVIGGGNLIADLDLNFPTKLDLAMRHAAARALPVVIFGCGMGSSFTDEGLRRLLRAFSRPNLRAVFLRDAASVATWDRLIGAKTGLMAQVVRDPGLLSATAHPAPPRSARDTPVIGLGLMSHVAIRYHSKAQVTEVGLRAWYLDVARALRAAGAQVRAFTNGSPEDVATAEQMRADLLAMDVPLDRPTTPTELSTLVADCDAIAAYRMHAVIAAYSHGVPALALAWDAKVASFMASVGRDDWLADPATLPADAAARRIMTAAEEGLDMDVHATVLAEAQADVARAFAVLQSA